MSERYLSDKQYDDSRRNKKARDFYNSPEWKSMRNYVYKRDGMLCQRCLKLDRYTPADVVHHKIELLDGEIGWENRLNEENLESICHKCHNKEHKKAKALPDNMFFDENGFPTLKSEVSKNGKENY